MFVSCLLVSLIRLINGSWVSGSSCLCVSCVLRVMFVCLMFGFDSNCFFLEHEIMDSIQYVWLVVV